ncbi:MAG: hypothetical protein JST89_01120 [Cyanobacteria bacterium SZAS-4]|nr:hypothetical protein [Cyanobacteria bacterium SZAS-4]
MPSLEMLKKLLDEFSEKEAHAREEINVITEQIGELEKRILNSQKKLSTVATDREKVRAMQARYSGGSTLTPGTPLVGAKTDTLTSPTSPAAEPKEEKRARPGRGGAAAAASAANAEPTAEVGIPVAPLNVRASSTRIPAMKLPETPAVAETPASPSSPFLSAPEQPAPAKAFSPMDIFGSPADQPAQTPATPEPLPYTEPAAAAPDYGVQYNAGASYEYQNAQPIDPVPAPNPTANPTPLGEITTSFFTPMGSTEASLQPPAQAVPQPQPEVASAQSPFLSTTSDPNLQPQTAQADDDAQVQDLDEDEPDDTVKSINDALRGLFR